MSWSRVRAPLTLLALVAAAVGAAACTESLEGGGACPSLCPSGQESFRDTTFSATVIDTSLSGFPSLGLSALMLVANRPDTVVSRGVLRFDVLPSTFQRNRTGATDSIRTIDSVFLRLPLDSTGRRGLEPVTIEAFDVDTTQNDSVAAVVRSLFRTDRRLGSQTFVPATTGDSLRIPLSPTIVQAKIASRSRLRIGLRITGGSGQIRVVAFVQGRSAPTVTFDPTTDTTFAPLFVSPNTSVPELTADAELAFQAFTLIDTGSPDLAGSNLVIGGFPAARSFLSFDVPLRITDSSTIVRAELLLTQLPSVFGTQTDSAYIVPLIPTATSAVTDLRRILDLSAEARFARLDSLRFLPSASGERSLNILPLVRTWPLLPASIPRAIAFRINLEGAQPIELRFHSSEALASLRPRLRITYLPRTEFALP